MLSDEAAAEMYNAILTVYTPLYVPCLEIEIEFVDVQIEYLQQEKKQIVRHDDEAAELSTTVVLLHAQQTHLLIRTVVYQKKNVVCVSLCRYSVLLSDEAA